MSAGRARTGIPNTDDLRRIFAEARSIAVVGASADPDKPGHSIPAYLQRQGYTVVPVNPKGGELFGERVVASLNDLEQPVDVVEVFRPPEEAADIAKQAIAMGARVLWFQSRTASASAVALAREAGLVVVAGRCMGETHAELGLGPGPHG
jgi:predicted CoA-binding protein